ncbi:Cysteine synthase A [Corynebacterium ciconiae DSM 44920]|nr:Cysteine synthase A [Corynebacterium ciconiae DSM 44920]
MVAVEPFGSVSFGSEHIADPAMLIAGIGSSIAFGNIRHDIFDAVHWVSSEVAASGCSNLLQHTGLFVGLSSGAAYVAAEYEHAAGSPRADHATVFLCPDTGHRYVESIMGHNCVSSSPHVALPRPHLLDRASARPKIALPWSRCSLR